MAADHTPCEGIEVTGWPVTTRVRGAVVMDEGKVTNALQAEQFLAREAPFHYPYGLSSHELRNGVWPGPGGAIMVRLVADEGDERG